MKWDHEAHIIGKVYDLTQENMNLMIRDIDDLTKRLKERDAEIVALKELIDYKCEDYCSLKSKLEEAIKFIDENKGWATPVSKANKLLVKLRSNDILGK